MKTSNVTKGFWFLFAAAFFFCPATQAQDVSSIITSNVRFRESWDGQMMAFTDGSAVEILNPGFKMKIPEWKLGTKLEILFNLTQGVRVFNPKTHQTFQVLELYNRPHPVDLWLRRCEEKNMSNINAEGCQSQAQTMWDQLILFDYRLVSRYEPSDTILAGFKKNLFANKQDWLAYRRSFSRVVGSSFKIWGTAWPIYAGDVYINMLRNQDRIVLSLLGTAMPFSLDSSLRSPGVPNLR
ncbi:hypothetical protein [Metallibacterium sp.]